MTNNILQTILSNSYTTDAVTRRMRLLRQYVEALVYTPQKKTDLETFLKEHDADQQDIESMKDWGKSFFSSFTKDTLEKTIKMLNESINTLATITVFVPVQMQEKEQENIGKWLRDNVKNDLLADIRYEPNLSVGCSVVYKGLYGDFSLRYYLKDKREEIVRIISSYKTERKDENNIEKKEEKE